MDVQVLEGVLEWAVARPLWQQQAICRLLKDDVDEESIGELADLCIAEQRGDIPAEALEPLPAPEDVTTDGASNSAVVLGEISNIVDVNALASDQTLAFATEGLTIVQGDNGSGKSGYVRILKQICRARSPQDVLPNAFAGASGSPSADITFFIEETEQTKRWVNGDDPSGLEVLSAVSVYDSEATSIYIDKDNDLAYRPFGLDLYDRLVVVCDAVKGEIGRRIKEHAQVKPKLDGLTGDHDVGRLISSLDADTPTDEVEALAVWTESDAEALRRARADLAQLRQAPPAEVAQAKREQATRARQLSVRLQSIVDSLSEGKLVECVELQTGARSAREAADLAAQQTFESAPLAGVGSEAWRRMWDAARSYSVQHPFPNEDFPATHDGAQCVLCQQELDADAVERLRSFDEFVIGQLQSDAGRLEADCDQAKRTIGLLDLSISEPLLVEIEQAGGPPATDLRDAMAAASARSTAVLAEWDEPPQLPGLRGADLPPQLAKLAEDLEEAASDLDSADGDAAVSAASHLVDTLEARERLTERRQEALDAIAWHRLDAELDAAKSGISSYAITQRSRQVTEEVVSQGLLDDFADKLQRLGASSLRVRLKPQARAGQLLHKLELDESATGAPPGKVLSEGERSVVGLAAFLSEIDLAPVASPIVLDDPVTSLDHARREHVVHHIYEQAQQRQVIVFTHDQVFVSELLDTFKNNNQGQMVTHHLVSRAADAGLVSKGPPWPLLSVNARIKLLNQRCDDGHKLWEQNDRTAYEDHAKRTLGLLRETWERAVEEVLLGGTVQRFSRQVRTLQLTEVAKLTDDDVAAVEAGMAFTSTEAHDQAAAAARPIPDPAEIRQQVATLKSFCSEYRKR